MYYNELEVLCDDPVEDPPELLLGVHGLVPGVLGVLTSLPGGRGRLFALPDGGPPVKRPPIDVQHMYFTKR